MEELLRELIKDRAESADIPWQTTEIIDKIEQQLKLEKL